MKDKEENRKKKRNAAVTPEIAGLDKEILPGKSPANPRRAGTISGQGSGTENETGNL